MGHDEKRRTWLKENLEGKISTSLMNKIKGEIMIAWNTRGGRYSGHATPVINRVIKNLNDGVKEEDIPFPLCDWNDKMIKAEKRKREMK